MRFIFLSLTDRFTSRFWRPLMCGVLGAKAQLPTLSYNPVLTKFLSEELLLPIMKNVRQNRDYLKSWTPNYGQ